MSRDRQIEEMAKDMCEYYYEGTCYQDKKPCDCECDIFTDAQYLYAKGYRKDSEVAREIFEEIERNLVILGDDNLCKYFRAIGWKKSLPNSKRNTRRKGNDLQGV